MDVQFPDSVQRELHSIYMFANTPLYLYKKIMHTNSIEWIKKEVKPEEARYVLIHGEDVVGEKLTPAVLYALLVVFGRHNEIDNTVWNKVSEYLQWVDFFKSYVCERKLQENSISINAYSTAFSDINIKQIGD